MRSIRPANALALSMLAAGAVAASASTAWAANPLDCVKDVLALTHPGAAPLGELDRLPLDGKIRLLEELAARGRTGQTLADFEALLAHDARAVSEDAKAINGRAVKRFLEPSLDADVSGIMNQGVYFLDGADGSPRVLKVFSEDLEEAHAAGAALTGNEKYMLQEFLVELRNAVVAEKAGGPKVYSFGRVTRGGQTSFYVEMEELYSGQGARTLKTLMGDAGRGTRALTPESADEAAEQLLRALREKIVPRDPDMMVGRGGHVRWIDSGNWCVASECPPFAEKFAGTVKTLARELDIVAANAAKPAAAPQLFGSEMIERFLARLKAEPGLSQAEKDELTRLIRH